MSIIIASLFLLAIFFGLSRLFPLVNEKYKSWYAFVPVYNLYIWLKIIEKPWWWIILLLFPGPNILLIMIMVVNTGTVFGYREPKDVALGGILPFAYLPYWALTGQPKYIGQIDRIKFPKTSSMEWRDAILFAVVAASIIRTYTFEAFTIPTGSMEKSLLIGDYLFVDKLAYGPKVPLTPLAFPFAHHSLPATNNTIPSYLNWLALPFYRIPGYSSVQRNDVVVFNFPEGDTVDVEYQANKSFNSMLREEGFNLMYQDFQAKKPIKPQKEYQNIARQKIINTRDLTVRPIDKRENYIKRCVGIPGDIIEVKDGILFIGDKQAEMADEMQYAYFVQFKKPTDLNPNSKQGLKNRMRFKKEYNVNLADAIQLNQESTLFRMPLTAEMHDKLKTDTRVSEVKRSINKKDSFTFIDQLINRSEYSPQFIKYLEEIGMYSTKFPYYPNVRAYNWTEDNFGPLIIPAEGMTVDLTLKNLPLFSRPISVYEGNELTVTDGKIYINGQETTQYTFKMNYYWLMGDNRHNSADSRFWGYVPEDHVVGKASFVWLSMDPELPTMDGGLRYNKMFRVVR
ncbi:MAG: signal peptidase I [Salibacteraceae bacterium]|jgi:signal peptidase I